MIWGLCSHVLSYSFKLISSFLFHQGKNKPFVEGLDLFEFEFWGWERDKGLVLFFHMKLSIQFDQERFLRMLLSSLQTGFYGAKMYYAWFWAGGIIRLIQPPTLWNTKISSWWNIGTNSMWVSLSDSIEEPHQKAKPVYSIVLGFRNLYLDFSYYRLVQPTNLIRKTSFL